MDVFFGIENLPQEYKKSAICIGNFDGIHIGHRQIIAKTVGISREKSVKSLMITFEEHPRIFFAKMKNKTAIPVLNTLEEKNEILKTTEIDAVLYLKTNKKFLSIDPEIFLKDLIVEKINASSVVIGYDFRFGKDRKGNVALMQKCGKKYNFQVNQITAITKNNEIVSSSLIRSFLENGNLETAEEFLGSKYRFSGKIVHGSGRGKQLGFPTANVEVDHDYKLIPAKGVYFAKLKISDEIKFGLCNIGIRPTFDEHELVIEIFVYENDNADLYDSQIEVVLLKRMRDEIKYDTVEELILQMEIDKQSGLQLIKQYNLD